MLTEKRKQYQREYREKNKDRLRLKSRRYYQSNKEKFSRLAREYYQKHGDVVRANAVRTGKVLRVKQRTAVLAHYSNGTMACVQCGFSDIRALCLDHINGGGTEQRRKFKAGGNVWFWLARHNFPPGYQILCANCNMIKAREEDEYGSDGAINADWRSQLEAQKSDSWVGRHRTWEDRMDEDYLVKEKK
jgi:hypothetical protein